MRRRQLKRLWERLQELKGMELTRDQLLLKLGAAQHLLDCKLFWLKFPD